MALKILQSPSPPTIRNSKSYSLWPSGKDGNYLSYQKNKASSSTWQPSDHQKRSMICIKLLLNNGIGRKRLSCRIELTSSWNMLPIQFTKLYNWQHTDWILQLNVKNNYTSTLQKNFANFILISHQCNVNTKSPRSSRPCSLSKWVRSYPMALSTIREPLTTMIGT